MTYILLLVLIIPIVLLVLFVYLFPEQATRFALASERSKAGLVSKKLQLENGIEYAYLEGGKGETLLLLHGFGGNKDNFVRVCRHLVSHYHVIVPDVPGFGESSRPSDSDYTLEWQIENLHQFCSALNLSGIIIGGNSMGGQLAMLYAARWPEAVNRLWLISPAGIWSAPTTPVIEEYRETGRTCLIAYTLADYRRIMAMGMLRPPKVPGPILNVLAQDRLCNTDIEEKAFRHIAETSIEDSVRGLSKPTLVVFGDKDEIISPETATVIANLLPDVSRATIEQAAHVSMFEKPEASARAFIDFMEK